MRGVRPETLARAARASLGLGHLALEHQLDVLSLNDISTELHAVLGLRPCFSPLKVMDEAGVLFGLEGDLGAATAMLVLNRLTGSPVFLLNSGSGMRKKICWWAAMPVSRIRTWHARRALYQPGL